MTREAVAIQINDVTDIRTYRGANIDSAYLFMVKQRPKFSIINDLWYIWLPQYDLE